LKLKLGERERKQTGTNWAPVSLKLKLGERERKQVRKGKGWLGFAYTNS
jgi:hypothetical protein